jgi:prolyl-tRNA synthetase
MDRRIKETGHQNVYFPLLIPERFLKREAEHVEGFAPECAVVTHAGGSKLEEPLIVRPTSETIINATLAKWIQSYRDLPVLINQWANIVRWEMRPRLFIRTTEFLWQEGHTAHETEAEAREETMKMLEVYRAFAEEMLAIPVATGSKSESQKFPGAVMTYPIEALVRDGKVLQAGTSHFLGQNFAKAFNVQFQSREGKLEYAWQTSWGVSSRLIGCVIMMHGDDRGLIMPPKIAPYQAVVVPIWKKPAEREKVEAELGKLRAELSGEVRLFIDDREQYTPGWKFNEWELRGAPVRIEIGPRDIDKNQVVLVRRDTGEKEFVGRAGLKAAILAKLDAVQKALFDRAVRFREEHTFEVGSDEEMGKTLDEKGGFIRAFWCGEVACEDKVKSETKATIRVIPFEQPKTFGKCIACGGAGKQLVLFARAY